MIQSAFFKKIKNIVHFMRESPGFGQNAEISTGADFVIGSCVYYNVYGGCLLDHQPADLIAEFHWIFNWKPFDQQRLIIE